MNIELKGFNGYAWRVCDTCPCDTVGGCRLGYKSHVGLLNVSTGDVATGTELRRGDHEYWAYIRPQECIDKHGK